MRNHPLTSWLLLGLLAQPAVGEEIKCWTDEEGTTSCGNVVPPEYAQKGYGEYNAEGIQVKKIEAAPSADEIAKRKKKEEEEEQRKKQEAEDRALLDIFSTEEDIERSRQGLFATIDGQIHSIETIVTSLENNLKDLRTNLEDSQKNPDVSASQLDTISKNIKDVEYRIKTNKETLAEKQKEREEVNIKHNEYLKKFRDIKRRGLPIPKPKEGEKESQPSQESPAN